MVCLKGEGRAWGCGEEWCGGVRLLLRDEDERLLCCGGGNGERDEFLRRSLFEACWGCTGGDREGEWCRGGERGREECGCCGGGGECLLVARLARPCCC